MKISKPLLPVTLTGIACFALAGITGAEAGAQKPHADSDP